jgi:hypothetical protein
VAAQRQRQRQRHAARRGIGSSSSGCSSLPCLACFNACRPRTTTVFEAAWSPVCCPTAAARPTPSPCHRTGRPGDAMAAHGAAGRRSTTVDDGCTRVAANRGAHAMERRASMSMSAHAWRDRGGRGSQAPRVAKLPSLLPFYCPLLLPFPAFRSAVRIADLS